MQAHPADLASIRSILFIPGHRERWLSTIATSAADAVALDLEDSVPPAHRAEAREVVRRFVTTAAPVVVMARTNAVHDDGFGADLRAAISPNTAAIVLPKVCTPEEVQTADRSIAELEREIGLAIGHTRLVLLIESASAIVRLESLLAASPRVAGTMFAGADAGDLARDLGAEWSVDPRSMLYARSRVLLESRAANVPLIMDSVYAAVTDHAGLLQDTTFSRALGFSGRPAIHPSQVSTINDAYSPTEAEVALAARVIDAYDSAVDSGVGALLLDGRLIDRATVQTARKVLARKSRMSR